MLLVLLMRLVGLMVMVLLIRAPPMRAGRDRLENTSLRLLVIEKCGLCKPVTFGVRDWV